VDDVRIGQIARALRRRKRWRQSDLAGRVDCHQTTISRLERGHLATLSVELIRRIFVALEARFEGVVSWRGADVERLLDDRHAEIVDGLAAFLATPGWLVIADETYSEYGERGSIDLLAVPEARSAAAVFEIKVDLSSIEATIRKHGEKARLAPTIVARRWGWRPGNVGRILVVAGSRTSRRVVQHHEATFRSAYPSTSATVRRWLSTPHGSVAGIWFWPDKAPGAGSKRRVGPRRVKSAPIARASSVSGSADWAIRPFRAGVAGPVVD
jgi:transcriptional regulator with XRE-family HTH domain